MSLVVLPAGHGVTYFRDSPGDDVLQPGESARAATRMWFGNFSPCCSTNGIDTVEGSKIES